ncbi:hypothetical protein IAU59_004395 [Kwoniella sp. CBS 9459]
MDPSDRSQASVPEVLIGRTTMPSGSLSIADVPLVPEEDGRPLKRSKTGCLTCRRRKKKCPEQYQGDSCLRCKAGGWKCIRYYGPGERSARSRSANNGGASPVPAAAQNGDMKSHAQPQGSSESNVAGEALNGVQDQVYNLLAGQSTPSLRLPQGTGTHEELVQAGIESDIGNILNVESHQHIYLPSSTSYQQPLPTSSQSYDAAHLGGMAPAGPLNYDMPMTNVELNQLSNWFGEAAINSSQPQVPSSNEYPIPIGPWQDLSFETLLDSAFSPWDSTAYASMGQMETAPYALPSDRPSDTAPLLYSADIPNATYVPLTGPTHEDSAQSPAETTLNIDCEDEAELLLKFYEAYIVPAWSCTYPPGVREQMVQRHRDVCFAHRLANICRLAASATYIHLIQRDRRQRHMAHSHRASRLDQVPEYYTEKWVDPEPILTQATLLVRSPKDVNLTVEAHLWALSDLHMAVTAYCEGSHANAVMHMAQQVFQVAYGNNPEFDIESKTGHSSWNLMVFAMIDLNHSLYSRKPTWFKFGIQNPQRRQRHLADLPFVNDGSHDNWFGLPATLITIMARVLNGIAEFHTDRNPVNEAAINAENSVDGGTAQPDPRSGDRTRFVNQSLRELYAWRSPWSVVDIGVPRLPIEFAAELAVEAEIWRHFCIVLVLRDIAVNLTPAQQKKLQDSINLVIDLLASLPAITVPRIKIQAPTIDFWSSFYTTPAFIVGSLLKMSPNPTGLSASESGSPNRTADAASSTSTTAKTVLEQRQIVRDMLMRRGPERAVEEMIMLLEVIWASTDETGVVADWHEEAKKAGIDLIFF